RRAQRCARHDRRAGGGREGRDARAARTHRRRDRGRVHRRPRQGDPGMSSKTYSEQRQAILFRAARDLRKVATSLLDDVVEDAELDGQTAPWALSVAQNTARLANDLEDKGHEQARATARQENDLYNSRRAYVKAFEAFEARTLEARNRKTAARYGS